VGKKIKKVALRRFRTEGSLPRPGSSRGVSLRSTPQAKNKRK
tara:strand:+ start:2783 stop:2908 length:126 start_codon:yes stop_codon:yes gene_type:complete